MINFTHSTVSIISSANWLGLCLKTQLYFKILEKAKHVASYFRKSVGSVDHGAIDQLLPDLQAGLVHPQHVALPVLLRRRFALLSLASSVLGSDVAPIKFRYCFRVVSIHSRCKVT